MGFFEEISFDDLSLYNKLFPGRKRFPFGENPRQAYNLTINNMGAMIASHEMNSIPESNDELRVFIVGDSSIWGVLLKPEETIAGQLNSSLKELCIERVIRVYNVGYPTLSLFKDLIVIDSILKYNPDMIIWFVTLESFSFNNQLSSPIVENNQEIVKSVINKYGLLLDGKINEESYWERTLIGRRRDISDIIRLQIYGTMWAATDIDQIYPENYTQASRDFEEDWDFNGLNPPNLPEKTLSFEVIEKAIDKIDQVPIIIINEPILISEGENSHIRYNYYYPVWAYDQYREMLSKRTDERGINYYDFWGLVPENQFTNTSIHLTTYGVSILKREVESIIWQELCSK